MGTAQQDWTVGKMTEYDDEPREDFGASRDEEVPEGVDPATGEITEQTPQAAATDDGSDALIKKAEKAQTNYAKRIRDIFGDNAPQYDCPTCNGLGLVWDVEPPSRQLKHPPELVACERCGAEGEVETGSKNPLYLTEVCTACGGRGYFARTPQPENVTPIQPRELTYQGSPQAPVMGWMNADGVFQPLGTPQTGNG